MECWFKHQGHLYLYFVTKLETMLGDRIVSCVIWTDGVGSFLWYFFEFEEMVLFQLQFRLQFLDGCGVLGLHSLSPIVHWNNSWMPRSLFDNTSLKIRVGLCNSTSSSVCNISHSPLSASLLLPCFSEHFVEHFWVYNCNLYSSFKVNIISFISQYMKQQVNFLHYIFVYRMRVPIQSV